MPLSSRIFFGMQLSHTAFKTHAQQLLRFDRKFHRQFVKHLLAEAADDHVDGVFQRDAAGLAVEELILADFAGEASCSTRALRVLHFDVRRRVRPAFVAQQQRIALRVIPRVLAPWAAPSPVRDTCSGQSPPRCPC